jgi:nucleotide-binding universal stress UspA family protein
MRILVATDLSEAATFAVQQAHAYALSTNGKLAVCHAVPQLQAAQVLFPQQHSHDAVATLSLREQLEEAVGDSVATITGRAADDFEVFIDEGVIYAEIVRRAAAWEADLIVVGGRGGTGLARLLLGSVADKVVRYAQCPVLVARPSDPTGCVLAATDLSDPSLPAVEAGAREARRLGVPLKVLHAVDVSDVGSMFGMPAAGPQARSFADMQTVLKNQLENAMARFSASGEAILADGMPAAIIVRMSETLAAGLIVVGTRGRTGLPRVLIGSVAEKVVRSAGCSVLVVRLAE